MTSVGSYSPGPDMVGRWVYLGEKEMKERREVERRITIVMLKMKLKTPIQSETTMYIIVEKDRRKG